MVYLVMLIAIIISCDDSNTNDKLIDNTPDNLEDVNQTTYTDINYNHFKVGLCETHKISAFVAYELVKEELVKNYERTDNFRVDPNWEESTANSDDYVGSGYDRGHLMPAADCTWDSIAMSESFYYTNIAPQVSGLNRGEWSQLEDRFRELVLKYDTVWITTGCMIDTVIKTLGVNQVSVPYEYYKAGLYKKDNQFQAIAFIMLNTDIDNNLNLDYFQVTIDKIEERLGLDLYYNLYDEIEKILSLKSSVSQFSFDLIKQQFNFAYNWFLEFS